MTQATNRRASRVTVDIDSYVTGWRLHAIRAFHNLRDAADEVEVRVSSSGAGVHLIGWFSEPLSDEEKERLRTQLGDDGNRRQLDRTRDSFGHVTNVLWTEKAEKGTITKYGHNIDAALKHAEQQTDWSEVASDVANYGHRAFQRHGRVLPLSTPF